MAATGTYRGHVVFLQQEGIDGYFSDSIAFSCELLPGITLMNTRRDWLEAAAPTP